MIPLEESVEFNPVPCPRCSSDRIEPALDSRWYGHRAPRAIHAVVCMECGTNFNGETGAQYPSRQNPIAWFLLSLLL